MVNVYVETSFFSACVSRRTDPQSTTWRATSLEWWRTQGPQMRLFISEEVIAELSVPSFAGKQESLKMLRGMELLELSPEVRGLAALLVKEKVMPGPSMSGDAIHVAAATVNAIDYLLSWNVKHMANINKRQHLWNICMRLGLTPPQIVTPDLLWEASDG